MSRPPSAGPVNRRSCRVELRERPPARRRIGEVERASSARSPRCCGPPRAGARPEPARRRHAPGMIDSSPPQASAFPSRAIVPTACASPRAAANQSVCRRATPERPRRVSGASTLASPPRRERSWSREQDPAVGAEALDERDRAPVRRKRRVGDLHRRLVDLRARPASRGRLRRVGRGTSRSRKGRR